MLKLRKATAEDVPTLVAMFQELDRMQRDWRVFTPRPGFYDEVAVKYRESLDSPNRMLIVAEEDGEVVGMAYGEVRIPSRFSDERSFEISGVMVRAGHRGRGVGRALAEEAARFAQDIGIDWMELKIFWPNEQAMGFWRTLGFTPRVVQVTAQAGQVLRKASETFAETG
ncbi:MAG TPA: GNAT family N-acetyltransferase [Actinomycetota bacterium]